MKLSYSLLAGLLLFGCAKRTDTAATDATTTSASSGAVDQVASDKDLLKQSIVAAEPKGNLTSALIEAARDSVIEHRLAEALAAVRVDREHADATNTTSGSGGKSTSKSTSKGTVAQTPQQKKDALDKANDALDKANTTVKKSGDVINKADEVARRTDDILHGRR